MGGGGSIGSENVLLQAVVGCVSGAIEVAIQQPMVGIKNAMQRGDAIPMNPLVLYRGVMINILSIAPITGIQFALQPFFMKLMAGEKKASDGQNIAAATMAGAVSGLVSGPAELIMIQQQKFGLSMAQTYSQLVKEKGLGILVRGLSCAMTRDGVFTAGYLGLGPVLQGAVATSLGSSDPDEMKVRVVAGSIAGVTAAVVTQPFDVAKTRLQVDLGLAGFSAAVKKGNVFSGLIPRSLRVIGAVIILGKCKDELTPIFEKIM